MAKTTSGRGKTDKGQQAPVIGNDVEDAEILNEEPQPEEIPEAEEPREAPTEVPTPEPEPMALQDKDTPRRGPGFLPLVLGGAVAAGLGFGGAWAYLPRNDDAIAALQAEIEALKAGPDAASVESTLSGRLDALKREQNMSITVLENRVGGLEEAATAGAAGGEEAISTLSGRLDALKREQAMSVGVLENRVGSLEAALQTPAEETSSATTETTALVADGDAAAALATLAGRLDALKREQGMSIRVLENRVQSLEDGGGGASPEALAGISGDIESLRADLATQAATVQGLANTAASQLEQTRASAAEIEQNALDAAQASALRVALARVQAAMVSGAPYALDLPDLADASGGALPPALTGPAETGVPTLLALQEAFPEAARAALATARAEGVSGEDESTVIGFLRTMFDVRSVEPREGDTTDAILSRAEAALAEGRLADTVAEVASLPEVVRAEFGPWSGMAQTRLDALAVVETLSQSNPEN